MSASIIESEEQWTRASTWAWKCQVNRCSAWNAFDSVVGGRYATAEAAIAAWESHFATDQHARHLRGRIDVITVAEAARRAADPAALKGWVDPINEDNVIRSTRRA